MIFCPGIRCRPHDRWRHRGHVSDIDLRCHRSNRQDG
jgi:hypothetical protein